MTRDQMLAVLVLIAARDGRTWPDDTAMEAAAAAWHRDVGHLVSYDAAERRVSEWYRNQTRRMMPADLRRLDVPLCDTCWTRHYDTDPCPDDAPPPPCLTRQQREIAR
jgi:hypothetical protein